MPVPLFDPNRQNAAPACEQLAAEVITVSVFPELTSDKKSAVVAAVASFAGTAAGS